MRIYIKDLRPTDRFTFMESGTINVCESRRYESPRATVVFHVEGTDIRSTVTTVGMSTVNIIL